MKKILLVLALIHTTSIYAKSELPTKITGLKTPESVVQGKMATAKLVKSTKKVT